MCHPTLLHLWVSAFLFRRARSPAELETMKGTSHYTHSVCRQVAHTIDTLNSRESGETHPRLHYALGVNDPPVLCSRRQPSSGVGATDLGNSLSPMTEEDIETAHSRLNAQRSSRLSPSPHSPSRIGGVLPHPLPLAPSYGCVLTLVLRYGP